MRIIVKVLPVVLLTSLGCIAQAGDPNGGPDESTGTSTQALGTQPARPVQQQRVAPGDPATHAPRFQLGNRELVGAPGTVGGGDPSQDPGDNSEPVPQPWEPHASAQH